MSMDEVDTVTRITMVYMYLCLQGESSTFKIQFPIFSVLVVYSSFPHLIPQVSICLPRPRIQWLWQETNITWRQHWGDDIFYLNCINFLSFILLFLTVINISDLGAQTYVKTILSFFSDSYLQYIMIVPISGKQSRVCYKTGLL
jgi:hypothetical protein